MRVFSFQWLKLFGEGDVKLFLFFVLGQNLDIKPPDGLPILNLGILIKGWGNLFASSPHDVMDCGLWEIWLRQPQWSFAMTLLIYLYLVASCMLKCISNTPDVVYVSECSFKDPTPKTVESSKKTVAFRCCFVRTASRPWAWGRLYKGSSCQAVLVTILLGPKWDRAGIFWVGFSVYSSKIWRSILKCNGTQKLKSFLLWLLEILDQNLISEKEQVGWCRSQILHT